MSKIIIDKWGKIVNFDNVVTIFKELQDRKANKEYYEIKATTTAALTGESNKESIVLIGAYQYASERDYVYDCIKYWLANGTDNCYDLATAMEQAQAEAQALMQAQAAGAVIYNNQFDAEAATVPTEAGFIQAKIEAAPAAVYGQRGDEGEEEEFELNSTPVPAFETYDPLAELADLPTAADLLRSLQ